MGKLIDRDGFRKHTKRRYTTCTVPGFGAVRIQSMTEAERSADEYELYKSDKDRGAVLQRIRARAIQRCVVDADGNRIYSDSKQDLDEIMSLDTAITNPLTSGIESHCGFLQPTDADIGGLEKNFETTQDAGLPTS